MQFATAENFSLKVRKKIQINFSMKISSQNVPLDTENADLTTMP